MPSISEQIVTLMKKSGLSRYEIARDSGIDVAVLSRAANGQTSMSLTNVERLADFLGFELVLAPKSRSRRRGGK
ncbi:MAG: helix-turn-helix transcriptional regulator [Planctomycetota bacterium]